MKEREREGKESSEKCNQTRLRTPPAELHSSAYCFAFRPILLPRFSFPCLLLTEPHLRPLPKKQQPGRRSDEGDDIRAGKGRPRGRKDSSFSGQITAPSRKPSCFPSPSTPSQSPRDPALAPRPLGSIDPRRQAAFSGF
jgi:hypothetical protein